MVSFSTGVTSTKLPSGSRRRIEAKSRTISGRAMGRASCSQRPEASMRMPEWPQWAGFHRWTGRAGAGGPMASAAARSRSMGDACSTLTRPAYSGR